MANYRSAWKTLLSVAAAMTLQVVAPANAQQAAPRTIKIRMDSVPNGMYSGFWYAQQRGYYGREGLKVEVLPGNGSNATIDGVIRGDTEFGFVTCWTMAVGVSKGRNVVSVAQFAGQTGFAFYSPKEQNVKTLKDLTGKTIVVSPAGFDTQIFPAVLIGNGLSPDIMKRVNVDLSQKQQTYVRGQADVINTHIAHADPLIQGQRPSNYILWTSAGFVLPDYCITTTTEKLEKEPQLVERFLRATYAAVADAVKQPDDAAKAALEVQPLLDRNTTEQQWKIFSSLFFTEDTKSCPHGWHSQKDWSAALATLQKYGGLEGPVSDHAKFYTNQFFPCSR